MRSSPPTLRVITFYGGTNELAANGKLADWDITPHLCQIRCPVLVLRGENDQATERVVSPLLSHISDCRAVTIPGSSHNPHEENIAPCLAAVSAFYAIWHKSH